MLKEVIPMLLLTLLFTITSASVLLLRKKVRGGIGSMMYLIWLFVLVMAILPLKLGSPTLRFVMQVAGTSETVSTEAVSDHNDLLIITGADDVPTFNVQRATLSAIAEEGDMLIQTVQGAVGISVSSVMTYGAGLLMLFFAMGFGYHLAAEIVAGARMKDFLESHSTPCTDADTLATFSACRQMAGISEKRRIRLRVIDEAYNLTPCVLGVFQPTVYLSAFCGTLDNTHLEHVILHELCHIKRGDILYKYFAVFVLSLHWVSPVCRPVRRAITEDIELACDASVLSVTGDMRGYMDSILAIAENMRGDSHSAQQKQKQSAELAGYMACNTAPSYLKRRYLHMKTTREKKHEKRLYTLCAGVLALIVTSNVALLSSCGYMETNALSSPADGMFGDAPVYTYDPIDVALRNYFGIPDTAEITAEMYAEIETIDFYILEKTDTPMSENEEKHPTLYHRSNLDMVLVSINGEHVQSPVPRYVAKDTMESVISPAVKAFDETTDADAYRKFTAFFALRDPADPALEESELREMLATYPQLDTYGAQYVYDPYVTLREDDLIYAYLCGAGIVDTAILCEEALTAKVAVNRNLDDVEIGYETADDIAAFDADPDLFASRGDRNYKHKSNVPEQIPENDGFDIDGDGVIETSND